MKRVTNYLNSLNYNKFFLLLIITGYFPIFIFGYFIQDDLGVVSVLSNMKFTDAVNSICSVNNNRPLSCIYHATLTRLPQVYQFYFFINLLFYIFFVLNLIKIFDFIVDNIYLKKIFTIFLIFPFFSYTILYSPAMQSMGTFALLSWSISLIFLKKFINSNNKINLFFSYFFLTSTFLVYESPFPLIALSLFFPLYFNNNKFKFFLFNILATLLILIMIVILQKFLIPKIYNIDLSRMKIDILDYRKIFFLISINLLLTLNIFFHSLEIFFKIILDFFRNPNFLLLAQVLLVFLIFYSIIVKKKFYKNNKNNKMFIVSLLIFFSVIFLNALMHTLANTGLEFIKYNNRALVSLSFIFAFGVLIIFKFFFNKKFLFNFIFVFLFSVFVVNFFYFQNNIIRERFLATSVNQKLNLQINNKKEVYFIFVDRISLINELLSYESYDYFHHLNDNVKDFLSGEKVVIYITEQKFCNKFYYNEYIYDPFKKNYNINLLVFNENLNNSFQSHKNITMVDFEKLINSYLKCDYTYSRNLFFLKDNVYVDNRYKSYFIKFLKYVYVKL